MQQTPAFSLPKLISPAFPSFCGIQSKQEMIDKSLSFIPLEKAFCHLDHDCYDVISYYNELWG